MGKIQGVGQQFQQQKRGMELTLWQAIREECSITCKNSDFWVDNGARTRFWADSWFGNDSLAASFSYLFNLSNQKDAIVADVCYYEWV